jgi:outer membrane protein W
MRKPVIVAVSLLFVVASAFAQQNTPSNSVSVFVSDMAVTHSSVGTFVNAGYGGAFDHMFNNHISAELSVTSQRMRQTFTTFSSAGQATYGSYTKTLFPIDANVSYHFLTDSRWKPYVGVGLRYLSSTVQNIAPLNNSRYTSRTVDPEISGGVTFQFRPNLGLRLDVKQTVGNSGAVVGDGRSSGSVGLSFRF